MLFCGNVDYFLILKKSNWHVANYTMLEAPNNGASCKNQSQILDVVFSMVHIISILISLCKVKINLRTFHHVEKVTLTIFLSRECVIITSGWSSDSWSYDPSVILGVAWQWPQSVWSDVCWHGYGCKLKQKSASDSWDTVTNTKWQVWMLKLKSFQDIMIHTVYFRPTSIEYGVVCYETSAIALGNLLPHQLHLVTSWYTLHFNRWAFWRNCKHNSNIMHANHNTVAYPNTNMPLCHQMPGLRCPPNEHYDGGAFGCIGH